MTCAIRWQTVYSVIIVDLALLLLRNNFRFFFFLVSFRYAFSFHLFAFVSKLKTMKKCHSRKKKYEERIWVCVFCEGERFIIKFKKRQNKRVHDARQKINRAKPTANGENIAHNAIRTPPKNPTKCISNVKACVVKARLTKSARHRGQKRREQAKKKKSLFGSFTHKGKYRRRWFDYNSFFFFLLLLARRCFFFFFSFSFVEYICIFASIVVVWTSVFALDICHIEFVVFLVAIIWLQKRKK